ncbi:MAG: hypothetical protein U0936_07370 [Planctomycetaceae bacterium]
MSLNWHNICATDWFLPRRSQIIKPTRRVVPLDAESDARFDKAFELLRDRFDLAQADERHPVRGNSVYTTSVVLWMPSISE